MRKGKMEATHPTFRVMDVICEKRIITVDFNQFEINKKIFRVVKTSSEKKELVNFSSIKPLESEDQIYLDYVKKEYSLIAGQQIAAQKRAEKNLSQRRV